MILLGKMFRLSLTSKTGGKLLKLLVQLQTFPALGIFHISAIKYFLRMTATRHFSARRNLGIVMEDINCMMETFFIPYIFHIFS